MSDAALALGASIGAATEGLLAGAQSFKHNGFKVELARRSIDRALRTAGGLA